VGYRRKEFCDAAFPSVGLPVVDQIGFSGSVKQRRVGLERYSRFFEAPFVNEMANFFIKRPDPRPVF